jgi:hypothetical protein
VWQVMDSCGAPMPYARTAKRSTSLTGGGSQ